MIGYILIKKLISKIYNGRCNVKVNIKIIIFNIWMIVKYMSIVYWFIFFIIIVVIWLMIIKFILLIVNIVLYWSGVIWYIFCEIKGVVDE